MVGDRPIGRTMAFDAMNEGSIPSPRTSLHPRPCRLCGGPTWRADEEGAVHPCCVLMWEESQGCVGCRESRRLNKEQGRRSRERLHNRLTNGSLTATEDIPSSIPQQET